MPKRFNKPRVWRVSSQAIRSTKPSTRSARGEISSRLPIGVATMKSVPGMFVTLSHRERRKTKAPRAFEEAAGLRETNHAQDARATACLVTHPQIVRVGDYVKTRSDLAEIKVHA